MSVSVGDDGNLNWIGQGGRAQASWKEEFSIVLYSQCAFPYKRYGVLPKIWWYTWLVCSKCTGYEIGRPFIFIVPDQLHGIPWLLWLRTCVGLALVLLAFWWQWWWWWWRRNGWYWPTRRSWGGMLNCWHARWGWHSANWSKWSRSTQDPCKKSSIRPSAKTTNSTHQIKSSFYSISLYIQM